MLVKHYAWHARDTERKYTLARQLLEAALEIAQNELAEFSDLRRQLRRDIAELDYDLDKTEKALDELIEIGDGFRVGDYFLGEGRYEEALKIYEQFHVNGRFKNYWRLWRCSFLLDRFKDVVSYIEQDSSESPQRVVTELEARVLAVAAVAANGHFAPESSWQTFNTDFPNCAHILKSKIGDLPAVLLMAKRWLMPRELARLRERVIGKPKLKEAKSSHDSNASEFNAIVEKARKGIWDIPQSIPLTATTILKELAASKKKLNGQTAIAHMAKGLIHPLILDVHKQTLIQITDFKLARFEKAHNTDLITMYREIILGRFGFYEANELSKAIKTILLEAESEVRAANGLPPRGAGWLAESEMIRLLIQKFFPHEVIRQFSPDWLQGMRFDAYIPDFQLAIEYQGEQHFRPIDIFGGDEGFHQTTLRDLLKRSLAEQEGVRLEYIKYDQDIDQETTRLSTLYLV
jgi:tetratricopeptide (TPR) repeat protein